MRAKFLWITTNRWIVKGNDEAIPYALWELRQLDGQGADLWLHESLKAVWKGEMRSSDQIFPLFGFSPYSLLGQRRVFAFCALFALLSSLKRFSKAASWVLGYASLGFSCASTGFCSASHGFWLASLRKRLASKSAFLESEGEALKSLFLGAFGVSQVGLFGLCWLAGYAKIGQVLSHSPIFAIRCRLCPAQG
jgi:hypothetical protein